MTVKTSKHFVVFRRSAAIKSRQESGLMLSSETNLDGEKEIFADSENGFRAATPPPPILPQVISPTPPALASNKQIPGPSAKIVDSDVSAVRLKSFDKSSYEASAIPLSLLEKVAPPVAFAGGTQTISANRKNIFHKDLAAQKEAQSHEEAIR